MDFYFEQLDAGGFGVIFFARDKKKNLKVACKLMELGKDWNDSRIRDMKNVSPGRRSLGR